MYLLDSNVFIEAKNRYYAFDLAPVFWIWLDELFSENTRTISNVRDEILDGNDELAEWMKERKDQTWILDTSDRSTQENFADIANEVNGANYNSGAVSDFLSKADPWLIAKAVSIDAIIVTHEQPDPLVRRRVPLPNICKNRSVECMDTFDFLRAHSRVFAS